MSLHHPTAATGALLGIDDEAATDPGLAGQKVVDLARLIAFGFPVLPGVVLSTDAVDQVRALGTVPEDVRGRLALALRSLDGPVAVRSSGAAEDLPGASFAGQYETFLGVEASTPSRRRSCGVRCRPARSGSPPTPPGGSGTRAPPGRGWPS